MEKLEKKIKEYNEWLDKEPEFPHSGHYRNVFSEDFYEEDFRLDTDGDLLFADYNKLEGGKPKIHCIPKSKLEQLQKFLNDEL